MLLSADGLAQADQVRQRQQELSSQFCNQWLACLLAIGGIGFFGFVTSERTLGMVE
jgi:hypothetical protein